MCARVFPFFETCDMTVGQTIGTYHSTVKCRIRIQRALGSAHSTRHLEKKLEEFATFDSEQHYSADCLCECVSASVTTQEGRSVAGSYCFCCCCFSHHSSLSLLDFTFTFDNCCLHLEGIVSSLRPCSLLGAIGR